MSRLAIVFGLLALAGCAGPLAAHREEIARSAVARTSLATQLVNGNLRVLASGTLGGEPVTWMIDTGASEPTITPRVAAHRALLESTEAKQPMLGITGWTHEQTTRPTEVAMLDVREDLAITVPDREDGLDGARVVGILSPQRLASDGGAVEIDLARLSLFRLGAADAPRAREELAQHGVRLEHLCVGDGCVPAAQVSIDGRDATLLVDTGSAATVLFADSAPGVAASMNATARVFAWANSDDPEDNLAIVGNERVRVGARTVRARHVVVLPRPDGFGPHIDGMLGMDVLRGCALLLDRAALGALACEDNDVDSAPILATLARIPAPRLADHAPALPRGVVARLGCETLTDVMVADWAHANAIPVDRARAALIRERTISRMLREGLPPEDVSRSEALVRATEDRLERVPVTADPRSCTELWPRYWPEQIVIDGLSAPDEVAVRIELARQARGGVVVHALPEAWDALSIVRAALGPRAAHAHATARAEGSKLRIRVTL